MPFLSFLQNDLMEHMQSEEGLFGPSLGGLDSGAEEWWREHLVSHAVLHHHASWGFSTHPKP